MTQLAMDITQPQRPLFNTKRDGYVVLNGEYFTVWIRDYGFMVTVGRRETGTAGTHFKSFESFLLSHPGELQKFLKERIYAYERRK